MLTLGPSASYSASHEAWSSSYRRPWTLEVGSPGAAGKEEAYGVESESGPEHFAKNRMCQERTNPFPAHPHHD